MLNEVEFKNLQEELELSDEAMKSLVESIEAAVSEAVTNTTAELTEKHNAEIEELTESFDAEKESLTEKVSEYTDYVIAEYIKENQEKFDKLELFEKMERVFENVKTAFEENGFSLDENSSDARLQSEVVDLTEKYNNLFIELSETKESLETAEMSLIFEKKTANLTDTQKEKLYQLSESVNFNSIDEFSTGLDLLIGQVEKPCNLNESVSGVGNDAGKKKVNPKIDAILSTFGK